jgi:hypothetical protein
MKRIAIITAWISALAVAGPAVARESVITLTPAPAEGQTLELFRGHPTLSSTAATSGVVLVLTTAKFRTSIGPVFLIGVKNVAPDEVGVAAEQISATSDAGAVEMLTAEAMKEIALRESSAMRENAAREVATGRLPGSRALREEYNRSLADRRIAAAQHQMGQAEKVQRGGLQTAEATGFTPFKVASGQTSFAPVRFFRIPDRATKVDIRVEVNGETHSFAYAVTRTR